MPKPKLPDSIRRVTLFGRVTPPTKDFLKRVVDAMPAPDRNEGRAIDKVVESFRGIRSALDKGYKL
jgi:hypothetical protein